MRSARVLRAWKMSHVLSSRTDILIEAICTMLNEKSHHDFDVLTSAHGSFERPLSADEHSW